MLTCQIYTIASIRLKYNAARSKEGRGCIHAKMEEASRVGLGLCRLS
jgi:hypothetical protein